MPQEVRKRQHTEVAYSANKKKTEKLERGFVIRELYLRLQGQLTLTAANNTAAKTKRGDEWAVIDNLRIIANESDVIRDLDANAVWWLNFMWYGVAPPVTPTLGDASTANPSFDSLLIVPFWMPRSIRPMDTALDARRLSSLKIEVQWGSHTSINGDATGWETEPTLEVHALESFNVDGPFAQFIINGQEVEIDATNARFEVELTPGNVFRGFLLNTTDAGADDGDVLNNFQWRAGTTVYADQPERVLEEAHRLRGSILRPFNGSSYDDLRIGDDNDIDGWYLYDHVTDGFMSEAIDTLGFASHRLRLDVTKGAGETKLHVFPFEVVPVRGQGQ